MQSKMPDCCAAANCNQCTDQSNIVFFRFPLDPERSKQWLNNCQRPDLLSKTPEELHRLYKLCANHFEPALICRHSELKTGLKDGAVPTIFDFASPLKNTQSRNRKRVREPTQEELETAKKSKEESPPAAVVEEIGDDVESPVKEDPAVSKAKETLKLYFKEILAFTGFSISNSANPNAVEPMSSRGGLSQFSPACKEKIDSKEVLQVCEDLMGDEMRNSLRTARFFSIILQDVANIEGKEQIPVFIRSVTVSGFPQKHFMGFLPCDMDTESLVQMLLSAIRNKWGLRMEHCRGMTYLTSGSVCQKMKDLSSRILREFPQVVLAPSDPYAFNMWLIRCMPILSIQKVVSTVEEVASLLRSSLTLWHKVEAKIASLYGHMKGEVDRIKDACQNHWEYGIDAFQTMLDILEPLLCCINEMNASDMDITEQLARLRPKMMDFGFIITLVILKNTLCCVSILNPSLKGIISISSTLQYTISNALKLLNKQLQEIAIVHRRWFSDAVLKARKLGVVVTLPETWEGKSKEEIVQCSPEDFYREALSMQILKYLVEEVKRVFSTEMVRILRWLSLVPSYMADHNFSIRRDKVADANLNNLARPDSFYDELGCWEVKWKHASKRRILPTTVFSTLKIPDIGFYPNVQSLLKVLGTIPCVNAEADVYGQYDMVLDRYHSYLRATPEELRLCNMAFVFINQDVHFSVDEMVESYTQKHPDILQLMLVEDDHRKTQLTATDGGENDLKEEIEETKILTFEVEEEKMDQDHLKCAEPDKESLKAALQAALTLACNQNNQGTEVGAQQGGEMDYVTRSEMKEVLSVCEDVVRQGILSEVGNSFFSLFIDRVVTLGNEDHLPLFLRFVDSFDVMRLELMGFVEADLDCDAMSERLLHIITEEWKLNLNYCRGQAYLGSGDVSYKLKAFACKIQEKYPLAICTHCSCYSFNTWWSRSIPVPAITRALETMDEVLLFFGSDPALIKQLDQVMALGLRESYEKVQELQGKFSSVWLEKHDSYEVFVQILEPLVVCLDKIRNNKPQRWKASICEYAGRLFGLIRDFDFIVPMVALKNASCFTRELSAGLQKDHFSAASQLCQISGIVATLNRVKTNIKVFHQNWFDEACAFAQSLSVQIKVPEYAPTPRDGMLKPANYYKDALSVPLVDNLINAVKDHFSEDHKEALNFLSLVPCSVTVSYMFEILKSKPPLYSSDLPDPENFFTELCCWRVKWKTKVVTVTIPDTIFQTLRLPVMQYFGNINTLLRIMCVLPSTALEPCGETMRHKLFQDYLRESPCENRSSRLAMLKVGMNFNRDLDRMVAQCLKVTPKALEGLCLDKESRSLAKHSEMTIEGGIVIEGLEDSEMRASTEEMHNLQLATLNVVDANGHSTENEQNFEVVFEQAAQLARRNCAFSELSKEDQDLLLECLGICHWTGGDDQHTPGTEEKDILVGLVKSVRKAILSEAQESPFFSLITDKVVTIADKKYLPTFIRYVSSCVPKVELLGFLPFDGGCDSDAQAKRLEAVLTEDWGLHMDFCRGQAYLRMGTESNCLKTMSMNILGRYPQAVNTPSESCGLAYWLMASLPCAPVTRVLEIVEDLLMFFDQSERLEGELAQAVDILLNTPREALAEIPETCCSRWHKREDFFDILVDTLEGVLSCLDSVSSNASGNWSSTMSVHADILSQAVREADFVVVLVMVKNVCAPLRNCSTVFRCGNPADIICEVDNIASIIESLNNTLENINTVHAPWFEEATQLVAKVASRPICYPEKSSSYESPEAYYRETLSKPVLSSLMEELKHNFSGSHLSALKVLSLLPTCDPLAVVSKFSEELRNAYQADLPEPDSAEQDICNWASYWKEEFQEASPPASISETLLHPKSQDDSTVSTLLKIVAVLPSVSMECDLMKTTLNSMRFFLRNSVCKNNKLEIAMLHMHRMAIPALVDVLNKCIDVDPNRRAFLLQVLRKVESLKRESELEAGHVDQNNSVPEKPSGMQSAFTNTVEEQQMGEQKSSECAVMSFYSLPVREEILKDLWDSQFFSIITEQVTDIEGKPYIPICVRYLDKQDAQCEECVALVPFTEDASALADTIETTLSEKWGLNMEFCRGQAVLSTGSIGSLMKAVSATISQKYPLATSTISSSVSLNMWLARSSTVPSLAYCVTTLEKMFLWFTNNAELLTMFEDKISLMFPQEDGKEIELKDRLTTDWGKSHDMFEVVVELLEAASLTLYEISRVQMGDSLQNQARDFFSSVSDFEFVFSVVALKNITALTKNLSQSLQDKPLDMFTAVSCLPTILASLNEVKTSLVVHHNAWFMEAKALAAKLQIRLLQPALEDLLSNYYRNTVSLKAVEYSIAEITEIFPDQALKAMKCLTIVPYVLSKMVAGCEEDIVTCIYKDDLPDIGLLANELKTWNSKWNDPIAGYLPTTVLDTLKVSDIRCFCNIETLLRVLIILPFSRRESTFHLGRKSLQAFMQQEKRVLSELHSL